MMLNGEKPPLLHMLLLHFVSYVPKYSDTQLLTLLVLKFECPFHCMLISCITPVKALFFSLKVLRILEGFQFNHITILNLHIRRSFKNLSIQNIVCYGETNNLALQLGHRMHAVKVCRTFKFVSPWIYKTFNKSMKCTCIFTFPDIKPTIYSKSKLCKQTAMA